MGLWEVVTMLWVFCEIGLSRKLSAPPSLTHGLTPFLTPSSPFLDEGVLWLVTATETGRDAPCAPSERLLRSTLMFGLFF